jgi:3-phosphoglycerate kinase
MVSIYPKVNGSVSDADIERETTAAHDKQRHVAVIVGNSKNNKICKILKIIGRRRTSALLTSAMHFLFLVTG